MLDTFKRITKAGLINFIRSGIVSWTATFVLTLIFSLFIAVILLQTVLNSSIDNLKKKINITIYFTSNAPEDKIIFLQSVLKKLPEIKEINYISREDALTGFKERHISDYSHLQTLEEIGNNPFSASLIIKAKEISQYETIANFLKSDDGLIVNSNSIIYQVNYNKNKLAIDRFQAFISGSQKLTFFLTLFLLFISVLIIFNTIKFVAFTNKEELTTICFLGASRACINSSFITTGIIYSLIASILSVIIFFPITFWFSNNMTDFLGLNIYDYYTRNAIEIWFIILLFGIGITSISSFFAIKRYLR